jgi:hypothetical protein
LRHPLERALAAVHPHPELLAGAALEVHVRAMDAVSEKAFVSFNSNEWRAATLAGHRPSPSHMERKDYLSPRALPATPSWRGQNGSPKSLIAARS